MARKRLFMESTEIQPERTAGEIISLLVGAGARQISQQYDDKKIVGVFFTLEICPGVIRGFKLPVRVDPIYRLLGGGTWNNARLHEQAERVAWRQLYRWTQAQLALTEVGMAAAAEVFLPYMQDDSGSTVYQHFLETAQKQLTAGSET